MATAVKSLRIGRGGYNAELRRNETVLITSDQRLRDMQEEIKRLQNELLDAVEITQNNALLETNKKTDAAFKNGYSEGYELGMKEGRASVAEAVETINSLVVEIESGFDSIWSNCRKDMVELTIIIVRKIVGAVADQCEDLAKDLAKKCTTMVRDQAKLKILVNPRDAEILRSAEVELMSLAEGVKEIEIAERASIRQGGVIIETENGQIDARIDEQLAAVEAVLKPGWNQGDRD
jgi:flagellar assembly protein FliH